MRRRLGVARLVVVVEACAGLLAAPALLAAGSPGWSSASTSPPTSRCRGRRDRSSRTAPSACRSRRSRGRLPWRRPFEDELHRLALALRKHAVADEAVADADDDPDLADLRRELRSSPGPISRSSRRARSRAAASRWPARRSACRPRPRAAWSSTRSRRCRGRRCWRRESRRAWRCGRAARTRSSSGPCSRTPPRSRDRPRPGRRSRAWA